MKKKTSDALASLPAPGTRRWPASQKGKVVAAVNSGVLSPQEACDRYSMSMEELTLWLRAMEEAGLSALKVSRLQQYPDLYKPRDQQAGRKSGTSAAD